MASPLKPWEQRGAHLQGGDGTVTRKPSTQTTAQSSWLGSGNSPPPTVPPRPTATYSSYNPYPSSRCYGPSYQAFGGYGGYGYRPFGMYGGGYGPGYGSYGEEDSQFVRQAEESTRTAFQSVESVVGAFASVSMMLESTYFAVHSCFRAVLGVAQHFTRLRNHVWSIIAAIALLRRLRYWLKKILRALRLQQAGNSEDAWDEVSLQHQPLQVAELGITQSNSRMWPVVMFFVIVFGVPWLLWKVLSALLQREESEAEQTSWSSGDGQPLTARALYDFHSDRTNEMSFSAGDELVLAPRQLQNGWLLAGRNRRSGLIPANYVQILPPGSARRASSDPDSAPRTSSPQDLLNDEKNLLND